MFRIRFHSETGFTALVERRTKAYYTGRKGCLKPTSVSSPWANSYTIGEGVAPEARFPNQLVARLRASGRRVAAPHLLARTGWTTDELTAALGEAQTSGSLPAGPFDLVTLLIGVNNQYRGLPLAAYRESFRHLLRQAVTLAGERAGRVLVLSIPDWGVTPFAAGRNPARITAEIAAFNAANQAESRAAGARYVPITLLSRQAAGQPHLLASDGLHPSGQMYAAWVEALLPAALAALASA